MFGAAQLGTLMQILACVQSAVRLTKNFGMTSGQNIMRVFYRKSVIIRALVSLLEYNKHGRNK